MPPVTDPDAKLTDLGLGTAHSALTCLVSEQDKALFFEQTVLCALQKTACQYSVQGLQVFSRWCTVQGVFVQNFIADTFPIVLPLDNTTTAEIISCSGSA